MGGYRNDTTHQLRAHQTSSLCSTQKENIKFQQLSIVLQISQQQGLVVSMWIVGFFFHTLMKRDENQVTGGLLKNTSNVQGCIGTMEFCKAICLNIKWVLILVLRVVIPTKVIGPIPTLTDIRPQTLLSFASNQIILDCQS